VLRHRRLQPARREAAEQLCGYMARQARTAASRRSFRHSECQERVGPCQPIRRTRRLVAVIRIDDARLLTLAADGPGNKRVPGARRLGGRSILANGVNRRSGLQLAVGQFKTGSSSSTSRIAASQRSSQSGTDGGTPDPGHRNCTCPPFGLSFTEGWSPARYGPEH
jgi:hypothetical protein